MEANTTGIGLYSRFSLFLYLFMKTNRVLDQGYQNRVKKFVDLLFLDMPNEKAQIVFSKFLKKDLKLKVDNEKIEVLFNKLLPLLTFHKTLENKKEQNRHKKFICETMDLYFKLNFIMNRVDVAEAAYYLRDFEYDFYIDDLFEEFESFKSESDVKNFIIETGLLNDTKLKSLWFWANISDRAIVKLHKLNEPIFKIFKLGERSRRVRLEIRLNWGVKKMFKYIESYRNKYSGFIGVGI
jgi:hypothetical protein